MPDPGRPSLKDVARAAGVHPSTVSLALRNHARISARRRSAIQAIARRLGYRPDPLLDAFNRHRLEVLPSRAPRHIAVVSDFGTRAELQASPLHAAALAGTRDAAAALHCRLDLFLFGPGQPDARRLDAILAARGIRALLPLALRPAAGTPLFAWTDYACLAVDSQHLPVPLYAITADYRQAARKLWLGARQEGRRRIGFVLADPALTGPEARAFSGYLFEECRASASPPPPAFLCQDQPAGRRQLVGWLREHRIDALLASRSARDWLVRHLPSSAPAPRVFDDPAAPPGRIAPDYFQIGRQAVEQLIALMQSNHRGPPPAATCTYVPLRTPV